jgi:hypothetical protein
MRFTSKVITCAATLAIFLGVTLTGVAQPVRHPYYLHALSDLRTARAHLERPNHGALEQQEKDAIHEIDLTIAEIKKASIDDGKDLNDHPPVDAKLDWPGRLHRAIQLIDKAHQDMAKEEDNKFAQGLQQRAFGHLDKAHHHAEDALHIAEHHV